jgi:hypothetical protein
MSNKNVLVLPVLQGGSSDSDSDPGCDQADLDNRANQLNPNNPNYGGGQGKK